MNPTTTKRITLAIALLSTAATALAAVEGVVSPAWALLIGAVGSGAYAVVRALQKIKAGADPKALLKSTETWGAVALALAA
jgi:hypothetical protein